MYSEEYKAAQVILNQAYGYRDHSYENTEAYIAGYAAGYNDEEGNNPHEVGSLNWALYVEGEYSGWWNS